MQVRTRFAPSPTGDLHIGSVRTALFSWLYARHFRGTTVLRIEDTDLERSTNAAIEQILAGLAWAGLGHDEGPFRQTERSARYREVIAQLLAEGKAYRCDCTKEELESMRAAQVARGEKPRYDGRCRRRAEVGLEAPAAASVVAHATTESTAFRDDPVAGGRAFVVRFKNPLDGKVIVDDAVHGRVVFDNAELDDLIIARSDGSPTYNFCVVVDDMDMRITHVIRGDDHLNNTPRQMNMLKALDAAPPVYAHLPMILGADGAKLSKRHGAVSVLQYRDEGYLPEALLNYLARLGWSHGDQEVFSLKELEALFDIADVNKSAAAFNGEKLLWLNQQHIARSAARDLVAPLKWQLARQGVESDDDAMLEAIVRAQQERAKTMKEMALNSLFFFRAPEAFDEKAVRKHITADVLSRWNETSGRIASVSEWSTENLHSALNEIAADQSLSLGQLAQPLRLAMTGRTVSPPIDVTLQILGREQVGARMRRALSAWQAA